MSWKNKHYVILAIFLGCILGVVGTFVPFLSLVNVVGSILITVILLVFYITLYQYRLKKVLVGAPFLPTSDKAVKTMVKFANIKPGQKVIDLGSGNGKILLAFANKGATATGYELNPILFLISKIRTKKADRITVKKKSLWDANLSEYDVIAFFGIEYIMEKLEEKILRETKPGTKVISNKFIFPNIKYTDKRNDVYLYEIG